MRGARDIGTTTWRREDVAWALIGILLAGCSPHDGDDASTLDSDPPGVVDEACASADRIAVSPSTAAVRPRELVQLHVTGGSGRWRASLAEDVSGGVVGERTAAYTAGDLPGTDVVEVADEVCGGSARASIDVLDHLRVLPRHAEVRPGTAFTLQRDGGSGAYACVLQVDTSGAALDGDCRYTAGAVSGRDTIRVTDTTTGEAIDAYVDVSPDAALRIEGEGGLFVPLGSRFVVTPRHGSGLLSLEVVDGGLTVDDAAIVGDAVASGHVRVVDRFTGEQVVVPGAVLAPRFTDAPRDGERTGAGVVLGLGDKDGDGYADAVLGSSEISIDAHQGGAVVVYRGSSTGLRPTPVQVIAGGSTFETLGDAVALADVDGDGEADLLVGDDRVDKGETNTGGVRVHKGVVGGFFEPAASRTFYGEIGFERLGTAIATCDFDGDGRLDLAVGAEDATDRAVGVPAEDQGGVYVYRGADDGFGERPDFVLYGRLPDGEGGFEGVAGLHLGASLAAGDLDGDGRCDLAAGAPEGAAFGGGSADGVVLLWRGTTDDDLLIEREPTWVIAAERGTDGELGHLLAAGDVDGDGKDELVVAHPQADGSGSGSGAVLVFRGGAFDGLTADDVLGPEDADVVVSGAQDDGRLGTSMSLADLDGDHVLDLVAGADQARDDHYKQGVIYGWTALAGAVRHGPSAFVEADATFRATGAASYDRLGQALGVIGDADDDGDADLLALAGFASTYGEEAGVPTFVAGGSGALTPLEMPGVAAGHDYGRALALLDVGGTTEPELIVGAPGVADAAIGANSGVVEAWTVGAHTASTLFGGLDHLGGGDRDGWALSTAGDFDGDGHEDLAVVARTDSRPAAFVGAFANPDACPGLRTSAGAVRVFRGGPDGLATTPAFVWFGPRTRGYVQVVAGGFDHDGDGHDDLVLGSVDWGDGGGFAIVSGRDADPDGTTVICASSLFESGEVFDRLGAAVAPIGDLDDDGCDEVAVGATGEELRSDWNNQGVVRVLWGHGPACARDDGEVTTVSLEVVGAGLGSALVGGEDVDGDDVPDLLVGGTTYRVDFAEVGGAWLVPGAWLRDLPRQDLVSGDLPAPEDTTWSLMLADRGLDARLGLVGTTAAGLFGGALAVVDADVPLVAIGEPGGSLGHASFGGGVRIHRYLDGGLDPVPWMIVGGEATPGELGATLVTGRFDGRTVLAVGAPESDHAGLDLGAVYVVPLH